MTYKTKKTVLYGRILTNKFRNNDRKLSYFFTFNEFINGNAPVVSLTINVNISSGAACTNLIKETLFNCTFFVLGVKFWRLMGPHSPPASIVM